MKNRKKINFFVRFLIAWGIVGGSAYILDVIGSHYDTNFFSTRIFGLDTLFINMIFGPILIDFYTWYYGVIAIILGIVYFIYGYPRSD